MSEFRIAWSGRLEDVPADATFDPETSELILWFNGQIDRRVYLPPHVVKRLADAMRRAT